LTSAANRGAAKRAAVLCQPIGSRYSMTAVRASVRRASAGHDSALTLGFALHHRAQTKLKMLGCRVCKARLQEIGP
jgi:hypothetical protein